MAFYNRNGLGLLLMMCFICLVSANAYGVDYQQEGRVQSTDTLPAGTLPCVDCDLQNEDQMAAIAITADKKAAPKAQPITLYADRLFLDDKSGDAAVQGNVIVDFQGQKLEADVFFGNTKTEYGFIPGTTKIVSDRVNVTGQDVAVDGKNESANIKLFGGKIDNGFFSGESLEITPGKITVYNSTLTSCTGTVPDYHITADRIEIFPSHRAVLYNAHIYFRNTEVASLREFSVRLKQGPVPFPTVGYWSDTGFWINEDISVPLFVNNAYLDVQLAYFQKYGFAPNISAAYENKAFTATVMSGFERDDQGNWIRKLPDVSIATQPIPLGKAPVDLSFSASAGMWVATNIQSYHRTVQGYLQGNPIVFPDKSTLSLGAGGIGVWDAPQTWWSFPDVPQAQSQFNPSLLVDTVYSRQVFSNLSAALEFHYQSESTQIFDWNNPNASYAGVWGISWQPEKLDSLNVKQTIDLLTFQQTQLDTTWTHDWHNCWQTVITYHWATQIFEFNLTMTNF